MKNLYYIICLQFKQTKLLYNKHGSIQIQGNKSAILKKQSRGVELFFKKFIYEIGRAHV